MFFFKVTTTNQLIHVDRNTSCREQASSLTAIAVWQGGMRTANRARSMSYFAQALTGSLWECDTMDDFTSNGCVALSELAVWYWFQLVRILVKAIRSASGSNEVEGTR